jgi:hypothetical protein
VRGSYAAGERASVRSRPAGREPASRRLPFTASITFPNGRHDAFMYQAVQ